MVAANGTSALELAAPTFDFSRVTLGDDLEMSKRQQQVAKSGLYQMKLDALQKQGKTPDPALVDKVLEMMDAVESVMNEMPQYFARVVTYVPADWFLTPSATRDFTDPVTYLGLRADKAQMLAKALQEARQPNAVSGN
jgi:hypothetical protein